MPLLLNGAYSQFFRIEVWSLKSRWQTPNGYLGTQMWNYWVTNQYMQLVDKIGLHARLGSGQMPYQFLKEIMG